MFIPLLSCLKNHPDTGSLQSNNFQLSRDLDAHRIFESTGTTNSEGLVKFSIDIEEDIDSLLLQVQSKDHKISVEQVIDPRGQTVLHWEDWYGDRQLTEAVFAESSQITLNYPVLDSQSLSSGMWEIKLGVVNTFRNYTQDVDVHAKLIIPKDRTKELFVKVIYDQSSIPEQTLSSILAYWHDIYSITDIELVVETSNQILDDVPVPPHEIYEEFSADSLENQITIILTDRIGNEWGTLGMVGSIPGSSFASSQSIILISWLAIAGTDGSIDSESDKIIFAETFAHEVGHYLGLFHPVEDDFSTWDALEDTIECNDQIGCEQELQNNIMFPYPVCTWNECLKQDELTSDQIHTLQHYAPL